MFIVDRQLSAVASNDVVHINTSYNSQGGTNSALSDHDPAEAQFDFRSFAELLAGTGGADSIDGLGGSDRLRGLGGADTLSGGAGTDRIEGGAGADVLTGGAGADRFVFGSDLPGARDRLTDLSVTDRIVTTTALADRNGNGIITYGLNKAFNLDQGGSLLVSSSTGKAAKSLSFDTSYIEDGVTYYVYGLPGAASSPAALHGTFDTMSSCGFHTLRP